MNVKLFFETHGRFPSQQEFRLIKENIKLTTRPQEANKSYNPQDMFVEAAKEGNLEECQRLIPLIRSVDAAPPIPYFPERTRGTALCLAAQGDHIHVVKYLLDMKAAVDTRPSQNRTPLLFAAESGHFNTMNYLISRGATYFTYSDQQIESYYISYTIRQSITRRELSYVLPGEVIPGIVLDYLGLGGQRIRPIERLAPLSAHNKNAFGARPIPSVIISPIPNPPPIADIPAVTPITQRKRTGGSSISIPSMVPSYGSGNNGGMSTSPTSNQVRTQIDNNNNHQMLGDQHYVTSPNNMSHQQHQQQQQQQHQQHLHHQQQQHHHQQQQHQQQQQQQHQQQHQQQQQQQDGEIRGD